MRKYKFISDNLINQLIQTWNTNGVLQIYQNIILQYLDFISPTHKKSLITKEIHLTKEQTSFFFTIQHLQKKRAETMYEIEEIVSSIENKQHKTQGDIEEICIIIARLRTENLIYAQTLLNLHHYFLEHIQSKQKFTSLRQIFLSINEEMNVLKASIMRKFIVLSKNYDPFLLTHYELLQKTGDPKLKEFRCIEKLFQLSMNEIYRLKKAHREIKQYLQNSKEQVSKINNSGKGRYNNRNSSVWQISEIKLQTQPVNRRFLSQKLKNSVYLTDSKISKLQHIRKQSIQIKNKHFFLGNKYQTNDNTNNKEPEKSNYQFPHINSNTIESSQLEPSVRRKSINMQTLDFNSPISEMNNHDSYKKARTDRNRTLDILEQRQKQFKNVFPKRFTNFGTDPDRNLSNNSREKKFYTQRLQESNTVKKKQMKEVDIQCQLQQQQNVPLRSPPLYKQKQKKEIPQKKYVYKSYKMTANSVKIDQLFTMLSKMNIQQEYRQLYEINHWQNSIKEHQYYCHRFYIDDQLRAISLCCGLPQSDIIIKYWGPMTNCGQEMSNFMFNKYLQHLEKQTLLKVIYYNAEEIPEVIHSNFIRKNDRIFQRKRVNSSLCQETDYHPFLSVDFTIIAINKSAPNPENFVNQGDLQVFYTQRFLCFNYLLIMSKLLISKSFASVSTYHPNLKSMKQCQVKMAEQQIQNKVFNIHFQSPLFSLLTLKIRNTIFSAFFIAQKGYIKTIGEMVSESQTFTIIALQMLKLNTRLYFGKGIKSVAEMVEKVKKGPKINNKRTQFSVRMFTKRICGKMPFINLQQQDSYGDLSFSFIWRDFIQGNLQHNMNECKYIFDEGFYCLLQMQGEIILVLQIDQSNFI